MLLVSLIKAGVAQNWPEAQTKMVDWKQHVDTFLTSFDSQEMMGLMIFFQGIIVLMCFRIRMFFGDL